MGAAHLKFHPTLFPIGFCGVRLCQIPQTSKITFQWKLVQSTQSTFNHNMSPYNKVKQHSQMRENIRVEHLQKYYLQCQGHQNIGHDKSCLRK